MRRTPSRTDLETRTIDELVEEYGDEHALISRLKSFTRHDSDRNRRNQEREEKALRRKAARRR